MNNRLTSVLTELGLSSNEAKVYYAALAVAPAAITEIAKAAEINRTTAYAVIERLEQKGLINREVRGFKTKYVAANPENLEQLLESRRSKLADIMPEFLSLYNLKAKDGLIKYYQGLEACKSVYETLLKDIKPHEDYLVIADQEKWYELDPEYFQKFIERRAKLNINIRLIFDSSKLAHRHQRFQKNYNEQIKLLPPDLSFKANMIITPQHLVFHHLIPPISAIVIDNPAMIAMQQKVFNILWESLT